jgi:cyclopropane fatty-acyl-phospholipid synthase-like methyltransferase
MNSTEPSNIVVEALKEDLISKGSKVLDLGCGKNPRNTIYLAQNYTCIVDAVDLEQAQFSFDISKTVRKRIHFQQGSVVTKQYGQEQYQAALLIRLIQYLSPCELETVFTKVEQALVPRGILILSYTASGGILNKTETYDIQAYSHPLDQVLTNIDTHVPSFRFTQLSDVVLYNSSFACPESCFC